MTNLILHVIFLIPIAIITVSGLAFIIGGVNFMRSKETDDSNIFNYLRVFGHISKHPGDLAKIHYVYSGVIGDRPFWYIGKDEYSEIVKTRP